MATFFYQGLDSTGRRVKGVVAADSARAARDQLRQQGLRVKQISERTSASVKSSWLGYLRSRRYQSSLTEFYRELTTLLQASVPLLDAVDSCLAQVPPGLHAALSSLRNKVSEGASVADAMAAEPWLFDEMTIGMVRVGDRQRKCGSVISNFRESKRAIISTANA